jgi:predicted metalloendopeptidase
VNEALSYWIPAGILQAPFFDYENSDAQNYGSVGTILGHEMSHGFDDDGRRYDAKGEMKDWWQPETVEGFKKRSGCISSLFDTYKVMNKQVNGKLTLGEDIADAGGIKFSYRAFLAKAPRTEVPLSLSLSLSLSLFLFSLSLPPSLPPSFLAQAPRTEVLSFTCCTGTKGQIC